MYLLLPSDMYDKKVPDPDFADEARAATHHGFSVVLFHLESLRENDLKRTLAATPEAPRPGAPLLYRGWMLSGAEYATLYDLLQDRGFRLITDPKQYAQAHYLPNAYQHLAGVTPESVWTIGADLTTAWHLYQEWGRPSAIVKDYVKSAKHRWKEACFLPEGCERDHFESVLTALGEYRGPDFAGGFVLRRFVPLRIVGETSFGQPLHEEHRLFFMDGECLVHAPFAVASDFDDNIETWREIACRFESRFLSLDVARTESDEWTVVETGDGGVSGLPDGILPEFFYAALPLSLFAPSQN
ncbi:MAG: ATP-grasp domain-containing protein [Fibrella sp.]|nr:ATP-grasp domain-containing protein [Armatimonadota bacterium]